MLSFTYNPKSLSMTTTGADLMQKLFFCHVSMQMFVIDRVDGDSVSLGQFDISGSKYTPEGEV